VVVAITKEDEVVVVWRVVSDVVDESGTFWPLTVEPAEFISKRVCVLKDTLRVSTEIVCVSHLRHRKSTNWESVYSIETWLEIILPRDVATSAGCEDLDVGVPRETLRDVAGVKLCAAVEAYAIALDDDGEFHRLEGSVSPADVAGPFETGLVLSAGGADAPGSGLAVGGVVLV